VRRRVSIQPSRRRCAKGFAQAMHDPALIAEAAKINLELNCLSGEDVQALVERLDHSPPGIIARTQAIAATH
jgi:hypothetical protein